MRFSINRYELFGVYILNCMSLGVLRPWFEVIGKKQIVFLDAFDHSSEKFQIVYVQEQENASVVLYCHSDEG